MALNPMSSFLYAVPPSVGQDGGRQPAGGETEAVKTHHLPLHPTILEGLTGVHLLPPWPPPIQPSAGLLISHPVPPAPPCLSWGGLRPGTAPERLNQNKS